jgi:hypothetical protein
MLNFWRIVGGMLIIILAVQACRNDQSTSLMTKAKQEQSVQTANDNQEMIATVQDVANVTANAFSRQGITSGRISDHGESDEMECHPSVTSNIKLDRTRADSIIYSGVVAVDYGNGTNCADSLEMRKGMVIDSFTLVLKFKDSVWFKLSEKITFVGYSRDSTQLDGSISIASSSATPTVVNVIATKIKYADGTTSTWMGNLVFTISNGSRHNWSGTMDVKGSWSGTTRNGAMFSANITKAIEFKSSCFGSARSIPIMGTVQISTNGVESTIDYGDGTCDKVYTITTGGVTTSYTFHKGGA